MAHNLVNQLRFARGEFRRVMEGVSAADGERRLPPMNCLSWMVGHLANQEQFYWVAAAQERILFPELNDLFGFGKPAATPPWEEMWATWEQVTAAADDFLEGIRDEDLARFLSFRGKTLRENVSSMLLRNTYHYWFHIGEGHALRQQLGHPDLPQFVAADMSAAAWQLTANSN